jgi:hypothetical protein
MTTTTPTKALADLEKRLREHDHPRLYREADELMSEAADAIAALARRAAQPVAPSLQIAEVAELPEPYGSIEVGPGRTESVYSADQLRDAIAASRRAPAPASAGQAEKVTCPECKGTGGVRMAGDCSDCNGKGFNWEPAEGAGQAGQVAKLADALNTMLWLYRRLPGAYGKPPFVDAALIDLAAIAGVDGVPEAIKERATLLDATLQPSAQVKP